MLRHGIGLAVQTDTTTDLSNDHNKPMIDSKKLDVLRQKICTSKDEGLTLFIDGMSALAAGSRHAVVAGYYLALARLLCPAKRWKKWVECRCGINYYTARRWQDCARYCLPRLQGYSAAKVAHMQESESEHDVAEILREFGQRSLHQIVNDHLRQTFPALGIDDPDPQTARPPWTPKRAAARTTKMTGVLGRFAVDCVEIADLIEPALAEKVGEECRRICAGLGVNLTTSAIKDVPSPLLVDKQLDPVPPLTDVVELAATTQRDEKSEPAATWHKGKNWTHEENNRLLELVSQKLSRDEIAKELHPRTKKAIEHQITRLRARDKATA